jgi:hypothetical protein
MKAFSWTKWAKKPNNTLPIKRPRATLRYLLKKLIALTTQQRRRRNFLSSFSHLAMDQTSKANQSSTKISAHKVMPGIQDNSLWAALDQLVNTMIERYR